MSYVLGHLLQTHPQAILPSRLPPPGICHGPGQGAGVPLPGPRHAGPPALPAGHHHGHGRAGRLPQQTLRGGVLILGIGPL